MTMRHIGWGLLWLVTVTAVALAYTIYLIFVPVRTIELPDFALDKPLHVETPVVHPGDVVTFDFKYCKYIDVVPSVRRQLVDGQIIPLTATANTGSGLPMGCHTTTRSITIPETVNPGRYYLNTTLYYQVNPLRTEDVHYYTEYFQVVRPGIPSTSAPPPVKEEGFVPPGDVSINQ